MSHNNPASFERVIHMDSHTGIYVKVDDDEFPVVTNEEDRTNKPNNGITFGNTRLRTFVESPILADENKIITSAVEVRNKYPLESKNHMFAINKGQRRWKTLIDADIERLPNPNNYEHREIANDEDLTWANNYGNYQNYMMSIASKDLGMYHIVDDNDLGLTSMWVQRFLLPKDTKEVIIEAVRAVRDRGGIFIKWSNLPQRKIEVRTPYEEYPVYEYENIYEKLDSTTSVISAIYSKKQGTFVLGLKNMVKDYIQQERWEVSEDREILKNEWEKVDKTTHNYFIRKVMYR